jgi:Uma2 family endonuclease
MVGPTGSFTWFSDGTILALSPTMGSVSGGDSLRPPVSGVRLTYDDFVQFPDDGKRHELIDGEHVVTPSPNTKHQTIAGNLHGLLWTYLRQHDVGRVFAAPFDVVFSDVDVVEPDLLFVSKARQADVLTGAHVRGAPDLVVEIGSPSTRKRDETVKRRLYEHFGVSEYWVIDPELDEIKVYRATDGRFERMAELFLENDDALESPLFPGLALHLAEIFAE